MPEVKISEVPTTATSLEAVATGKADAYISNLAIASDLIGKNVMVNLEIAAPSINSDDSYAMGVRKGWRELARLLGRSPASFTRDAEDEEAVAKHADIALYHATSEGKNTFGFYGDELNRVTRQRIILEQALRFAVERNELVLNYQPKFDLTSGMVSGVEALVRWNSPELGLVSPAQFIPLAEESHLIIPMGEWVLRTACKQQVAWRRQGLDLNMAVNLSSVQFKSPLLVETISRIIDESGITSDRLEFELTESALMDNPDEALRLLEQLRKLVGGIAIDDFGTGYSSLSYPKDFPVTALKIDSSFVRDLHHDTGSRAIVQSIVDLANNLNMSTVAEGVENDAQCVVLEEIGCGHAQGFLLARPGSADEFFALAGTTLQMLGSRDN